MHSLEDRIDVAIKQFSPAVRRLAGSVIHWKWSEDLDDTHYIKFYKKYFPNISASQVAYLIRQIGDPYDIADEMIDNASLSECLTSPSEYIRKRKLSLIQK